MKFEFVFDEILISIIYIKFINLKESEEIIKFDKGIFNFTTYTTVKINDHITNQSHKKLTIYLYLKHACARSKN